MRGARMSVTACVCLIYVVEESAQLKMEATRDPWVILESWFQSGDTLSVDRCVTHQTALLQMKHRLTCISSSEWQGNGSSGSVLYTFQNRCGIYSNMSEKVLWPECSFCYSFTLNTCVLNTYML